MRGQELEELQQSGKYIITQPTKNIHIAKHVDPPRAFMGISEYTLYKKRLLTISRPKAIFHIYDNCKFEDKPFIINAMKKLLEISPYTYIIPENHEKNKKLISDFLVVNVRNRQIEDILS